MEEFENVLPEPGAGKRDLTSSVGRFLLRALWEVASTVLPAVFITLFINVYVVQATVIDGPSMQPNLYYDQQVMVERITRSQCDHATLSAILVPRYH